MNSFVVHLLENSFIMSGVIFLLYILSRLLRGKTSPRLRLICWLIVAVGLLLPIRPSFYTVSASDILPLSVSDTVTRMTAPPAAPARAPAQTSPVSNSPSIAVSPDQTNTKTSVTQSTPSARAGSTVSARTSSFTFGDFMADYALIGVWALGALAFLTLCSLRYRRFARGIRRWGHPAADAALPALLEDVCREVGLRRRVRLLICPLVASPVITGLIRPRLILPDENIPPERLRLMLLHEVLHLGRGDVWAKALMLAAMAAHWFNPLVYLMNRALVTEMELACDAAVLRHAGAEQRIAYGEAILHTARRSRESSLLLTAAFSGSGRNLKRRLTAIIEQGAARRWVVLCCTALMLCGVLAAGMVSCSAGGSGGVDPIPQAKVDLTPTDSLVLDFPGWTYFSPAYADAVNTFKKQYPHVKVTVNTLGDPDNSPYEQYQTELNNALMAGKGPDVILTDFFTNDIYKTMGTGAFLNLNSIISGDNEFKMSDYNQAIMKAGYFKGGQYIMPSSFWVPILMTTQKELDTFGFDPANAKNFPSFMGELTKCLPKARENPAFVRAIYGQLADALYTYADVSLVNEETKQVLPNEADFRAMCEAYKPYYTMDFSVDQPTNDVDAALRNGECMFVNTTSMSATGALAVYLTWSSLKSVCEAPVLTPLPTMSGGLSAMAMGGFAINAQSENQLNAWNFIKIMLSEASQKSQFFDNPGGIGTYPVNNAALQKMIDDSLPANQAVGTTDGTVTLPALTASDKAPLKALLDGITKCSYENGQLALKVEQIMKPYFKDQKSLDDCVADLKNQLKLYVSE